MCEVCYVAKKYMLPHLVDECLKQLWRELYPRNACRAYEFAKLLEDTVLMGKSLQVRSVIYSLNSSRSLTTMSLSR